MWHNTKKKNIYIFHPQLLYPRRLVLFELVYLSTNWSLLQDNSYLFSNPITKTSNENQLEDSLSTSTLRTRKKTYLKKRPAEVTRPKKAAKESNKPKGP